MELIILSGGKTPATTGKRARPFDLAQGQVSGQATGLRPASGDATGGLWWWGWVG